MPEAPLSPGEAQHLAQLLALTAPAPPPLPAGPSSLGEWHRAFQASFPNDDARLAALATHDLRLLLAHSSGAAPEQIGPNTRISSLLPQPRRRAWDELRAASAEWTLPPMGLPAWAQHVFGATFIAGFVLPFFFPLPGSLVLPLAVPLSFILERRSSHLPWPTLAQAAARARDLSKPALEIGRIDPADTERAFYQLACIAAHRELPLQGWEGIPVAQP